MPEKPPPIFEASQDASIEELQTLVDQGLKDNAVMIAKFKLGELETMVVDIEKNLEVEESEISKDTWAEAKAGLELQIQELEEFLNKNK